MILVSFLKCFRFSLAGPSLACWMLDKLLEQLLPRAAANPNNPPSPSFPLPGKGSAAEFSKMRIFSHTEVIAARETRAEI